MRCVLLALLASAFGAATAFAEPMPISPRTSFQPSPPSIESEPAPVRVASAGPQLGGGFIEFLFGGGMRNDNYSRAPSYDDPYGNRYPGEPTLYEPDARSMGRESPLYGREPPAAEPARPAMDPRYRRQVVNYAGEEEPGTIIINTRERFLYLVQANGRAIRYGIGVGRPGFTWAGVKQVSLKREWPDWRPPPEMLKRRPDLPRYMPGGPDNPLGARAMYLGSSLYRIHGSNEPWTIGQAVSSGCIRMRNEDVVDLYDRVKVGTKVIVI